MSDSLPEMIAVTPLGGHEPRVDTHGKISIAEVTDRALASFTCRLGKEARAKKALHAYLSIALPDAGRMNSSETFDVFWTGPDQWMVCAPHETHETLAAEIAKAAKDTASITEQNDAWCRFDLTGEGLVHAFERLCPINMRAAQNGDATRTTIDHMGCFVLVRSREHITVLGPRSSAESLHHTLLTAIKSVS